MNKTGFSIGENSFYSNTDMVLESEVVMRGICTGCGACVAVDSACKSKMKDTRLGPIPVLDYSEKKDEELAVKACPAYQLNYPQLYRDFYGELPDRWLTGKTLGVRTGFASDEKVRRSGASGGVTTSILQYLLESGRVDGVIVAQQGVPEPLKARAVIVNTPEEVAAAAQSVYVPVSMLEILSQLEEGKRYAMTCLPDQSAALRRLACDGFAPAQQVEYVLGPYTGTALYPEAIDNFIRSNGVPKDDPVTSLKWRAGEWPGYLEIKTEGGRVLKSKKVYYNYLIPFFVTQNSLQNMDFVNEFADLAVGDAWSPKFEALGAGFSIFVTRSEKMEAVVQEMSKKGLLEVEEADALKATEMHGHMIDFKKRGGYIRNQWRRKLGLAAPDFGFKPDPLPFSRYCVEFVISSVFLFARTRAARWLVRQVPERIMGPFFDRTRLTWKALSKPTKRKGLGNLSMVETADN